MKDIITTEEELHELMGYPSELVKRKVISALDEHCQKFIAKSPFLVISSSDDFGNCDVSPRGDEPGFIYIENEHRLVIPERPGNKRMDTLRNILKNPRVGLIFFIPGLGETLRVNGKASITKNANILEKMAARGKAPIVGIRVEVEECFIHCAKAFKRSKLWEPQMWLEKDDLPTASEILFAHSKFTSATEIEERLQESYTKRL
ncbi:pyridoxamine 5'-phosphate oxidase family protein [Robertmurraya yapensis]|uniref:Pyridoxamine 5'-phosphate oxidase family protein n=1 Tax=Bacillus yapensis TaxID=2492960 RepID=A0A3S0LHN6_9BACI|nr:pyridoxamine 5'-phosphate oxidase family protein [Bacillus yapensis]RTR35721.1 pyridoxamine 5'-phosphate oxidase family protein [Bacillus yapensis]TKS98523.1 pyridoxamine 5'-phosphate oxidase family protein [Bacillus yapensis]